MSNYFQFSMFPPRGPWRVGGWWRQRRGSAQAAGSAHSPSAALDRGRPAQTNDLVLALQVLPGPDAARPLQLEVDSPFKMADRDLAYEAFFDAWAARLLACALGCTLDLAPTAD